LADQLHSQFGIQPQLVKGHGGVFEVSVDGQLIFSKKQERRFPDPGEVESQIAARLGP